MRVLVLCGGPDGEHEVSRQSGLQVAGGLRDAGHDVVRWELGGDSVPRYADAGFDLVFPALHGRWGEGGPLQEVLEQRGVPFVGCRAEAARRCMDKAASKATLAATQTKLMRMAASQVVKRDQAVTVDPPVVVKPVDEGSSLGLVIARDVATRDAAVADQTARLGRTLVEQYLPGIEATVGIIGAPGNEHALPPVVITPAAEFYDYDTKYIRDDTEYTFDALPDAFTRQLQDAALLAHRTLGCRHLSRTDFIVQPDETPGGIAWYLETNTMPGFTTHSLLPMAADHAGIPFPELCDRLVQLAATKG